jgi:hypothetical protein
MPNVVGQCRLCGSVGPLEHGHIVPKFIFRWLKNASATGYLRGGPDFNLRKQDGPRDYWLCGACEDRFNRWETAFCTQVFLPLTADAAPRVNYGDWLIRFCVSVSWRVLMMFREAAEFESKPTWLKQEVANALVEWARFLRDEAPNPGRFEQHLFPLSELVSFRGPQPPPNINRYFMCGVNLDIAHNAAHEGFVYVKLPYVLLLGLIRMDCLREWRMSRIGVARGVIDVATGNFVIPGAVGPFMLRKASEVARREDGISARQRRVIDKEYAAQRSRLRGSVTMRAAEADVRIALQAPRTVRGDR